MKLFFSRFQTIFCNKDLNVRYVLLSLFKIEFSDKNLEIQRDSNHDSCNARVNSPIIQDFSRLVIIIVLKSPTFSQFIVISGQTFYF